MFNYKFLISGSPLAWAGLWVSTLQFTDIPIYDMRKRSRHSMVN